MKRVPILAADAFNSLTMAGWREFYRRLNASCALRSAPSDHSLIDSTGAYNASAA
jgi:hypothetical protein